MNDTTDLTARDLPAAMPQHPQFNRGLQLFFDDAMYARVEKMAQRMAKATDITPKHLHGKVDACFFVIDQALQWNLNPMAVARATYQTPGGGIGNYGALVNAIIEQSGRLDPATGGVRFEHTGDWAQIDGKFAIRESAKQDNEGKPKKYATPTWTHEDAVKSKAGVIIRARLRGERADREFAMLLSQAFPLNSTLWATDPRTQLVYLATRRFANLCMPGVLMGFVDPANDAPPVAERDMGEADIVHEDIIMQPRAARAEQQTEAPAATQATSQTEQTQPHESDLPSSGSVEQPAQSSGASAATELLITAAALKILHAKLDEKGLMESFCKAFGLGGPHLLQMARVNDAFKWVSEQQKAE